MKRYVLEVTVPEGSNEFWESVKKAGTFRLEYRNSMVESAVRSALSSGGFPGAEARVLEMEIVDD